jgi:carbamoylphosphate synthase small subunit
MEGADLVKDVTCATAFDFVDSPDDDAGFLLTPDRRAGRPLRIAAYDYGMKWNILRRFSAHGCQVRVYPAQTPASELLASKPDGVFLSNGPGDPAVLSYAIATRRVIRAMPVFGSASAIRFSASRWARRRSDEVRASWRESSGAGSPVGQDRNHFAGSWIRRGP